MATETMDRVILQSKGQDLGIYRMMVLDDDGKVEEIIEDVFIQTDVVNGTKRIFKSVDGKMEEVMIRRQHGLADGHDPARGGIRKGTDVIGGFEPLTGEQDFGSGGGGTPPATPNPATNVQFLGGTLNFTTDTPVTFNLILTPSDADGNLDSITSSAGITFTHSVGTRSGGTLPITVTVTGPSMPLGNFEIYIVIDGISITIPGDHIA